MNTIDVLKAIIKTDETIEAFSFHTFPEQSLVQDRISNWSVKEQTMFDFAIGFREKYRLPFWDSLMLGSFNNENYSEKLLDIALHHNEIKDLTFVPITDFTNYVGTINNKRLAVNSQVKMKDGSIKHLPLLDFHIPVSELNQNIVYKVCANLNLKGYILNSGESYHYIGLTPVEWDNLYMILSKALLFCPIIDRAWVSHQLQEKSCSLRVDKKNGITTKVIALITSSC